MAESHYKWFERLSRNCAIGIAQFQNSLLDCYITAKSTYQSAIIFVNEFVQLATAQVASATFDSPERILTFCLNLVPTYDFCYYFLVFRTLLPANVVLGRKAIKQGF